MKKITIFLCSMIMLVFTAQMCFASEYADVEIGGKISDELKEEEIGVVNWTPVVELWHYSGGYWGSNWFKQKYNDNEMNKFFTDIRKKDNMVKEKTDNLDTKGVTIDFTAEYDGATQEYIKKNGLENLGVEVEEFVKDIFYYNKEDKSDPMNPQIKLTEDGIFFKAVPIFYIDGNKLFKNYIGSGLNNQIPIPAEGYGKNVYSMYAKMSNLKYGRAEGAFEADPSRIEYSDILDAKGNINPNKYLYITDSDGMSGYLNKNASGNFMSNNMKIGQGTFSQAGAVGIFYEYPVQFRFYGKKPSKKTGLTIKYWDKQNNKLLWERTLNGKELTEGTETAFDYHIMDWDNYVYEGWKIVNPDSIELESGTERDLNIDVDYDIPEKVLNVEFVPEEREYGILKARIVDKFTGEIIVSQQTPTDTLPGSVKLESSWLKNNLSGKGYTYDASIFDFNSEDCEVTDFDGNAIEEKKIEWTNLNGTYDSTMNMKKVNANTMKFYLTQEEPEMMITFYVTPQSGTADIMADCSDGSIKWKEKHSHTVEWEDLTGTRHTANCKHTIEYEAHLTDITCNITPEMFKSGYGFDLELSYGLSKVSITDKGGSSSHCDGGVDKDPEEKVSIADVAVFAFPDESYTVAVGRKEQYIQPYSFYLEVTENTGNRIKLQPPISEISVTGERKIFTPVSIAGTADKPVTHYATIQIRGGGVTDVEFCYNLSVPFTINGNMYEDGLTM